jgi:hypothetical protein
MLGEHCAREQHSVRDRRVEAPIDLFGAPKFFRDPDERGDVHPSSRAGED